VWSRGALLLPKFTAATVDLILCKFQVQFQFVSEIKMNFVRIIKKSTLTLLGAAGLHE
jgi:hypothetical protein